MKAMFWDAYEYLIGQFASTSGKKAGEFYTPQPVSELMTRIVLNGKEDQKGFTAYDAAMGSGSLLLNVKKYSNEPGTISYFGQELNTSTFVPSGKDHYELIPNQDEKSVAEVSKYIDSLGKSNPKLAELMEELWKNIQDNPEEYRDQNVSVLLENMIQTTRYEIVEDFSKKWCVNEDNLDFVVSNYNPNRKRQNGESELKETSDYNKYRETDHNAVSKLRY